MLGKHYLVQSLKTDAIKDDGNFSIMGNKRHYTVANTMRPEVYNSLVDTLRQGVVQDYPIVEEKNDVVLTVKNYASDKGLSFDIHDSAVPRKIQGQYAYNISGPMGLGLGVQREGLHVAFAAGTGVLAFVDLVSLIVRQQWCNEIRGEERIGDSFKLVMFNRARDTEQVAADLLDLAGEKCDKFEYNLQKTQAGVAGPAHWDTESIDKVLGRIRQEQGATPEKIWVCGTPSMSETFDKYAKERQVEIQIL